MKKRDPFLERADYIGETAREANRREGGGEPFFILPVPLISEKQCYYLRLLADQGIIGQTPHEVAAWLIMEGIQSRMGNKMPDDRRVYPPETWVGFEGEDMADYLESLRNRSCVGKTRHETFLAAQRQQSVGKRNPKGAAKGVKISPYHCQFCGGYHVGHSTKGKKK